LLTDVLDISRIEEGRLELHPFPFSLRECLKEAVGAILPSAGRKNIQLDLDVAPDVPEALVGDQVRLRQVLLNLLNNAAKFTAAGSIDVKVRLDGASGKTAHRHFEVRDTGVGIPPDKLERICEAFRQVDGSNTRRYGGTGLGLTISSSLAALMNGRLWVESTLGKGSEFHFTADFQLAADSAVQAQKEGAEMQDASAAALRLCGSCSRRTISSIRRSHRSC
jgi:signal transduction histidine kinase